MDKSPDAFRTISEVSEDLDLPQHVLRFWETRFGQIKPLKRGGGRRYYRPDDVELLRGIRHLLYGEGYTIKGVQRILKDEGLRYVQTIWKEPPGAAVPEVPASATAHALPSVPSPAASGPGLAEVSRVQEPRIQERRAQPPAPATPVPETIQADPASARPAFGHDQVRALQAALFELGECRRLLANVAAGGSEQE